MEDYRRADRSRGLVSGRWYTAYGADCSNTAGLWRCAGQDFSQLDLREVEDLLFRLVRHQDEVA